MRQTGRGARPIVRQQPLAPFVFFSFRQRSINQTQKAVAAATALQRRCAQARDGGPRLIQSVQFVSVLEVRPAN